MNGDPAGHLCSCPLLAALALWALPSSIGDRLAASYGSVVSGLVLVGSLLLWPRTERLVRVHAVVSDVLGDNVAAVAAVTDLPWIPAARRALPRRGGLDLAAADHADRAAGRSSAASTR